MNPGPVGVAAGARGSAAAVTLDLHHQCRAPEATSGSSATKTLSALSAASLYSVPHSSVARPSVKNASHRVSRPAANRYRASLRTSAQSGGQVS